MNGRSTSPRNHMIATNAAVAIVQYFTWSLTGSAMGFLPMSLDCPWGGAGQGAARGRLRWPERRWPDERDTDAPFPLLPARPEGNARRGADRLAPADAARGDDPAGERRHLFLAAAGLQGAAQHRTDRARGADPGRPYPDADADAAVGRALAGVRPLRRLRPRDAAHSRPA